MVVGRIDFECVEHGGIPHQRRIGVDQRRSAAVIGGKVVAKHDLAHLDCIFGTFTCCNVADNRFIRVLEAAVGHIQVSVGHGDIHRFNDRAACNMDTGGHVIEFLQIVQVL